MSKPQFRIGDVVAMAPTAVYNRYYPNGRITSPIKQIDGAYHGCEVSWEHPRKLWWFTFHELVPVHRVPEYE